MTDGRDSNRNGQQLQGRAALITGGGRGIGQAIARVYAGAGAQLTLAARTRSELENTAQSIRDEFGCEVLTVIADVSRREDVDHTVSETLARYGRLDVLVNNAGNAGEVGPLWRLDPERWANVLSVHILGTFYGCRAAIPAMLAQGGGRIVNMAGVGGPNDTSYDAAKTAIVNITENLAAELAGSGVTVNAISPGSIHTRMWEEVRDMALAAGDLELYEKGVSVTSGGGASIERAAELALLLGSDDCGRLSGRLIRAATDAFEEVIPRRIDDIMASDAFLLRRTEL